MTAPALIDEISQFHPRETGRRTDPLRPVPAGTQHCARVSRPRTVADGVSPREAERASQPHSAAIAPAATLQRAQLPAFAPVLEDLEIAGWGSHRRLVSGNFHDWLLIDGRELVVCVGQGVGPQPADATESALVAQAAWAAIRAHAYHVRDAGTLVSFAARSLWSVPVAGVRAAVAVAVIDPAEGHASLATAGDCLVWKVRAAACEQLAAPQPLLGEVPDFTYLGHSVQLSLRERLLLVADNPQRRSPKLPTSIAADFAALDAESHRRMMAADAVDLVRRHYEASSHDDSPAPASIVAVRRR